MINVPKNKKTSSSSNNVFIEMKTDLEIQDDKSNSNMRLNKNYYNNNMYSAKDTNSSQNEQDFNENEITTNSNLEKIETSKKDKVYNDSSKSSENSTFSNINEEVSQDFNLTSTIAHLQADLVYSIGVFIAAVIINIFPNLRFFDSICTILFSYVVYDLTVPIFYEATRILLEGIPEGKFTAYKPFLD